MSKFKDQIDSFEIKVEEWNEDSVQPKKNKCTNWVCILNNLFLIRFSLLSNFQNAARSIECENQSTNNEEGNSYLVRVSHFDGLRNTSGHAENINALIEETHSKIEIQKQAIFWS